MKNNPLLDKDFLAKLDQERSKKIYARIVSLTFDEFPIEEITGRVTGGSINIDGNSAIRRTCSVTLIADNVNINDYYWGVKTKFELYIGIENTIDSQYENIIWFKQGIFLITNFSTSLQLNNYTISIQGKDKMCLLNGDIGGTIESLTADFGKYDSMDEEGNVYHHDYLISEIIKEAVHHYAQEPYSNIIIKDLDMTGLELLEYRGETDLFLLIHDDIVTGYKFADSDSTVAESEYRIYNTNTPIRLEDIEVYDSRISRTFGEENEQPTQIVTLNKPDYIYTIAKISYGDTCGYRETDLTYTGDLIANVGESITQAVLDKIVSMLGNYEYFYDVDGHFIFQEKKNYINNSWNSIQNNEGEVYVENLAYSSPIIYSFLDSNLITNFQNTPNLLNLKNDFSIWGTKQNGDNEVPIHLRYAIDEKPVYYKNFAGKIYLTAKEYEKLAKKEEIEETEPEIIVITSKSRFKITPLPDGLSDGWWEIDDWTRRYLYMADVDDDQGRTIEDYINLTGQEVYDIVNSVFENSASIDPNRHDFNYYVYQLGQQLGNFATKWATEDWLNIFPQPSVGRTSYYRAINKAIENNQDYWAWLIDTDYSSETGKEYIVSVEHGSAITAPGQYPNRNTGCTHSFDFALTRKKSNGSGYHVYIYDPQVPDSIKKDTDFIEKEDTETITNVIEKSKYFICDWREIIYQMAYDYFHYQHNDNYNATIAINNPTYYPNGVTQYEQYYTDIYGFWREIYNWDNQGITSHVVDISQEEVYQWDNDKQEYITLPLTSPEYVQISTPQDVVNDDGEFYFVSGINKYSPYIVSTATQSYYSQNFMMDLSNFRITDDYRKINALGDDLPCDYGVKKVKLSAADYIAGKYITDPNNTSSISNDEFDENIDYYEIVPCFTIGNKYYINERWQKVNNFGAGITYYIQNFYQKIRYQENSPIQLNEYQYNENNQLAVGNQTLSSYTGMVYKKVDSIINKNTVVGFEREIYVNPYIQYFDLITTSSMELYSKVDAFLKGHRYYKEILVPTTSVDEDTFTLITSNTYGNDGVYYGLLQGQITLLKQNPNQAITYYKISSNGSGQRYKKEYVYDNSVYFAYDKAYYKNNSIQDEKNIILDLTSYSAQDYYYNKGNDEKYISNNAAIDKSAIIIGTQMKFFPGDIYYMYNKQNYDDLDNNYYYLIGDYYYLDSTERYDLDQTYYYDKYGTVAAINRDSYLSNTYYLKDNNGLKMFTKYNILHRFKRGFSYYAIENTKNFSLLSDKKYLLATFYPKDTTIFYQVGNSGVIERVPKNTVITENDIKQNQYYIAYGKYNYYYYTEAIVNNIVPLQTEYNSDTLYYNNTIMTKDNCVGYLTEQEWITGNYYSFNSALSFSKKEKSDWNENTVYYSIPALGYKIGKITQDEWPEEEELYVLNNNGIYLNKDFNIETYWNLKTKNPETLIFWFDFLDISTGGDLAQYSAHLIGNRPKSINDKDVKSIYYREVPNVIFKDNNNAYVKVFLNEEIFAAGQEQYYIYDENNNIFIEVKSFDSTETHKILVNGEWENIDNKIYLSETEIYNDNGILLKKYSPTQDYYRKWNYQQDGKDGYTYVNITNNLNNLFTISNQKKSAFNKLDDFLYNNSYCVETASITSIPIYYLEPNNRVLIRDDKTGINGEYLISKIGLQLTYNGTMSITATKAVNRIY